MDLWQVGKWSFHTSLVSAHLRPSRHVDAWDRPLMAEEGSQEIPGSVEGLRKLVLLGPSQTWFVLCLCFMFWNGRLHSNRLMPHSYSFILLASMDQKNREKAHSNASTKRPCVPHGLPLYRIILAPERSVGLKMARNPRPPAKHRKSASSIVAWTRKSAWECNCKATRKI